MSSELFDVINKMDEVVGQELRTNVHQQGLWHRGVHVLLFTQENKLLVQQRSRDRAQSPLTLDCSVSEHVQAGETYDAAAVRGLKEEMGVDGIVLEPLIKFRLNYGPNDNEISMLYRGNVEPGAVKFDLLEIERIDYYQLNELKELLKSQEQIFSYWFKQIIRWGLGKSSALEIIEEYSKLSTE